MVHSLVQWAPRTPLFDRFRREMDDLMERFDTLDNGDETSLFAPPVNVAETEEGYEVSLDLPGMKPEEVNIEWKDGQLWITGERSHESEEKGKTFHRIERRYGQFRRVLPLGTDVEAEKIEAKYNDGVLHICVPRGVESRIKRIEVKA